VFGVREARRAAESIAGRVAHGRVESKQTFGDAFKEYVAKQKRRNSAKWVENVEGIGRNHLAQWMDWRLDKLVKSPKLVREWHTELSKTVESAANHAGRLLRAVYNNAAREDTSLPRDRHPCTSIEWNEELPREIGITDWSKWARAWRRVENPVRKAYHLFALLTGCRPGELARIRWDGFNAKARTFTIKKTKNKLNLTIPLSRPLCWALMLARDARKDDDDSPFVFTARKPTCHIVKFDSDGLPWYGNHLRHTYISMCVGFRIDAQDQRLLTVHKPRGVHERYFVRMIIAAMPGLKADQKRLSAALVRQLGITRDDLRA
jgi:integrase